MMSERKNEGKKEYVAKQQGWLLFFRHASKCKETAVQCTYGSPCAAAKSLWKHILVCGNPRCSYPRCLRSRELLKHHMRCKSPDCPVRPPVKRHIQKQCWAEQQQRLKQKMLVDKLRPWQA